ncbi:hypothetical protein [Chitinilyticum piscinae]|uniref:DUF1887 family protein n=1 Tax=Chitinilyticum piscinae TaxID=2866724 RepID=A0A8J7FUH2_9NEIS|nr:hypothetical protein [Chitinilyticum piscinae]MBE9610821.1 hypothetical protein [Chitinilyticum piscinae]
MLRHEASPIYVCIISRFNQPELEACLTRKPDDLILIVSKQMQEDADRFTEVLKTELPQVTIHRPDKIHQLVAEDIECCQRWVHEVLQPLLNDAQFAGRPRRLNFTGGTKALTAVLLTALDWDELDYKAQDAFDIQSLSVAPDVCGYAVERVPFVDASPSAIARLHNVQVRENHTNPLCDSPNSLLLAQNIWNALTEREPALEALLARLAKVWSEGRSKQDWNSPSLTLTWSELGNPPDAAERQWLNAFSALAPDEIRDMGEHLVVPGNAAKKKGRHLRAWISGIWLEQLVRHWVIEAGIPEASVISNIAGSPDSDDYKRELDLLLNYRGQARLIEIKTDFPPGKDSQDIEKQISSLGDRFGRTTKLLFIGPQGTHQLDSGKINKSQLITKKSFSQRCKVSGITVIYSKEELFASIRGTSGA